MLSTDGTLWQLVESKGAPRLGGYRIQNVIEEESRIGQVFALVGRQSLVVGIELNLPAVYTSSLKALWRRYC